MGAGAVVERSKDRRESILEAATRLVAERGYHRVRIQDIARLCGSSTGTVHYHFPGKDEVLREALRYSFDKAYQRQHARLIQIDDARRQLVALIEMQLPTGGQIRDEWSIWVQVWSQSCTDPDLRAVHDEFYSRWFDTVLHIVERGRRQGIFRDADPNDLARRLTTATDGAGIQVLMGVRGMTAEVMRELLVGIVDREFCVTPQTVREQR